MAGETRGEPPALDLSVGAVLRLVGAGAGGQILMALGKGPLRTGQLAERIQGFSARSVYRYVRNMQGYGLIDRHEEPGVPSNVTLSLSDPAGRQLCRLLRSFAATPLARLPSAEGSNFDSWASLSLLGDLWESGVLAELSRGPRTLTELTGIAPEMTYHQTERRMGLYIASGLLIRLPNGHLRRYRLTEHGRRRVALVTGVGRWRQRHLLPGGMAGLTVTEMATVLRAALPLLVFPRHVGMSIELGLSGAMDEHGHRETEFLQGAVAHDGTMHFTEAVGQSANASAMATTNTWFAALLDGNRGRMRVRGDLGLVNAYLTQMHHVLWDEDASRPADSGITPAMPAGIGGG